MERLKQDKKKLIVYASAAAILVLAALVLAIENNDVAAVFSNEPEERSYIKWVDFNPTAEILNRAIKYDTESYGSQVHLNFIELLAYTAAKCGGDFSGKGAAAEMDKLVERLNAGELMKDIADGLKYYDYYITAYGAVLNGFLASTALRWRTRHPLLASAGRMDMALRYFLRLQRATGFRTIRILAMSEPMDISESTRETT